MNNLIANNLVFGGGNHQNILEAIGIAVQIYQEIALLIPDHSLLECTQSYAKLGQQLSEKLFEVTHPNMLGKMIYYPEEFNA